MMYSMMQDNWGQRVLLPDDVEYVIVHAIGGVYDWNECSRSFYARETRNCIGSAGRRGATGFAYNTRAGGTIFCRTSRHENYVRTKYDIWYSYQYVVKMNSPRLSMEDISQYERAEKAGRHNESRRALRIVCWLWLGINRFLSIV